MREDASKTPGEGLDPKQWVIFRKRGEVAEDAENVPGATLFTDAKARLSAALNEES